MPSDATDSPLAADALPARADNEPGTVPSAREDDKPDAVPNAREDDEPDAVPNAREDDEPDAVPSSSYATAQQPGEVLQLHTPLSPEHIRPFTKAAPWKQKQVGRRTRKTRILRDTPEKRELEILAEKRNKKMPTSKKRTLANRKQQKSTSAKRMRETEEHESESESAAVNFTSEEELSDDEGE